MTKNRGVASTQVVAQTKSLPVNNSTILDGTLFFPEY